MTLPVDEFLRRFLLHVLPPGFVRIRHFGFLAHRRRAQLLPLCFQLLPLAAASPQAQPPTPEGSQVPSTPSPASPWTCPQCGGPMIILHRLTATQIALRSPPMQFVWDVTEFGKVSFSVWAVMRQSALACRLSATADRFDEFLQSLANLMGRVFLQEVHALNLDFALVRPGPAEFKRATSDEDSGFAHDEQLRYGAASLLTWSGWVNPGRASSIQHTEDHGVCAGSQRERHNATTVKPGALCNRRRVKCRSCIRVSIKLPPSSSRHSSLNFW